MANVLITKIFPVVNAVVTEAFFVTNALITNAFPVANALITRTLSMVNVLEMISFSDHSLITRSFCISFSNYYKHNVFLVRFPTVYLQKFFF